MGHRKFLLHLLNQGTSHIYFILKPCHFCLQVQSYNYLGPKTLFVVSHCSVFIFATVIKYLFMQSIPGEKVFVFALTVPSPSPTMQGNGGSKNLKQLIASHPISRAEQNECIDNYLLACILIKLSPTCLGNGVALRRLGLFTSLSQDSSFNTFLLTNPVWTISYSDSLLRWFQVVLS